jgi:hypothetical protein
MLNECVEEQTSYIILLYILRTGALNRHRIAGHRENIFTRDGKLFLHDENLERLKIPVFSFI